MIPGIVEAGGGKILPTTSDDFNRANSTDITAVGKKWTETSGEWAITSNQLTTSTAASSYPIATLRTNTKNATVKVDRANGDGWGVAFWVVDQNNWFAANTEMTQSSVQNPASSGTFEQTTFTGNTCSGGKIYNGDSSFPPFGGTCYDLVCTSYNNDGVPASTSCPAGSQVVPGYCGGACLDSNYFFYVNNLTPPAEQYCAGGVSCCYSGISNPGSPATCASAQIQNCCIFLDATDSGCPGACNGQSPRPQYTTTNVPFNNPETRTWTYSQRAIIRKSVAGTVSVVASTTAVTSTETVAAAGAAGNPTRPTSLTVTLVGEGITISAPGAAGGTITGSHTATGANRGKKHGVSIAPATVVQSNAVDNFVYTKPS